MSSTLEAVARARRARHHVRRIVIAALAVGAVAVASPRSAQAALPACGGNQSIKVAPFTCENQRTIDGTTFTVVLDVQNDVVTVTYTLDAPRATDTPIRVRAHQGISSQPNVNEISATIPAGATSATLSVALNCGQIDVKAVFTGNGDARGRVTAPYVTNASNCQTVATTMTTTTVVTTTSTPGSSTTAPPSSAPIQSTTSPSSGSATTAATGHAVALPVTGSGAAIALLAAVLLAIGLVLATLGRRTDLEH